MKPEDEAINGVKMGQLSKKIEDTLREMALSNNIPCGVFFMALIGAIVTLHHSACSDKMFMNGMVGFTQALLGEALRLDSIMRPREKE